MGSLLKGYTIRCTLRVLTIAEMPHVKQPCIAKQASNHLSLAWAYFCRCEIRTNLSLKKTDRRRRQKCEQAFRPHPNIGASGDVICQPDPQAFLKCVDQRSSDNFSGPQALHHFPGLQQQHRALAHSNLQFLKGLCDINAGTAGRTVDSKIVAQGWLSACYC